MLCTHILGYPRMGVQRELKFSLEKFWRGEISAEQIEAVGRELRSRHWAQQQGLSFVSAGDFAFYDQMANHILMFGCEPSRFGFSGNEPELSRYFEMARGGAKSTALEMTKWFDTNYHYLVPEFHRETVFLLASKRFFEEVGQAKAAGHAVKPVLIGPLTFLWLGKSTSPDFDRLLLLDRLLPVYQEVLAQLRELGAEWVQIDEPILGLDLPEAWRAAFRKAYAALGEASDQRSSGAISLLLTTYFSTLQENLSLVCQLPVAGLHVDAVRAEKELDAVAKNWPAHKVLSVGVVDGRNIWRCDVERVLERLRPILEQRSEKLWVGTSCSLLHVPFTLREDAGLDEELRSWLSGAQEKLQELDLIKRALEGGTTAVAEELEEIRRVVQSRASSPRVKDANVARRSSTLSSGIDQRKSAFSARQKAQRARLQLPVFPTTTIGSFPQTAEIRSARASFKKKELTEEAYREAMRSEIAHVVAQQEALGLDVLVHGEPERNDMVEYFGEKLKGFAFSANGWVQSYGSRCVKPPVLFGDVSRPGPMTVEWAVYAQSLTKKLMKGMLTGPVTILQWSFVRDDQPRSITSEQIALAIRDEVCDLEAAGIAVIQIDEPAVREGLPLRKADWAEYLRWAARAFRIAASGVRDETQIHTHMCYAEFNDILPEIASMDADVITIETSRSAMELLRGFGAFKYPNEIGPGVYDIHSPRVPSQSEMVQLLQKAVAVIPAENLWVNPDCGLKTRAWEETRGALKNMVGAAHQLRGTTAAVTN